ncbi:Hypothetical protein NTJ_00048 [Nesidiocoris tenuis]|uniref:Uncharacterized protein n=1 Tax=Nesidiocoris tenuis TaxID=355587 RepID=A0ABN7A5U6_9HEMI|nr:Hypothetical protein NTJ_00048 [Nesidiocoris tenuis]
MSTRAGVRVDEIGRKWDGGQSAAVRGKRCSLIIKRASEPGSYSTRVVGAGDTAVSTVAMECHSCGPASLHLGRNFSAVARPVRPNHCRNLLTRKGLGRVSLSV